MDNEVEKVNYTLRDHLGSLIATISENGDVKRLFYDPWGKRLDLPVAEAQPITVFSLSTFLTPRGFTGHEHLDNVGLIHMNGRVYDPTIARFLSADPIIQDPTYLQNYNRYSYTWNNPLRYTDPSGFVTSHTLDTLEVVASDFDDSDSAYWRDDDNGNGNDNGNDNGNAGSKDEAQRDYERALKNQQQQERERETRDRANRIEHVRQQSNAHKIGRSTNAARLLLQRIKSLLSGAQDGHITLEEAKAWYQYGNGVSLNADLSKIDFGSTSASDFPNGIGSSEYINTFFKGTPDGKVYGTIKLTLIKQDTVVATFGYDDYDFNINWSGGRHARNEFTKVGDMYHGKGMPLRINLQGKGTLNP